MNLSSVPDSVWGGLAAIAGTVIVFLLRWLLGWNTRKKKEEQAEVRHQKAIDDSNNELAAKLRDEMRRDNIELRERVSASEARINDLVTDNQRLSGVNLDLMGKNGALTEKADAQAKEITGMKLMIVELQLDRQILVDALIKANIPLPIELYRKPKTGTGPLGQGGIN